MSVLRQWDFSWFLQVNELARRTGWAHGVLLWYALYGMILFGVLLVIGLLVARHLAAGRLAAAGWAAVGTLIAVGVNQPIGHLVDEARPYTTHPDVLVLAARSADFSFPSDHATMAGAVAAGLFLVSRRLGAVALAAGLVLAFARVYVGAHYPWDVAGGLLLGGSVVLLGWLLVRRPVTWAVGWLRQRPLLRPLLLSRPS